MDRVPAETLIDVVHERAALLGDAPWVRYLVTGEVSGPMVVLSYAQLLQRSLALAAWLREEAAPGDRALLFFPSGVEFLVAFFGCLFAGVIPVPAYPPGPARPERALEKVRLIAADSGATLAITTSTLLPRFEGVTDSHRQLAGLRYLATDTCELGRGSSWRRPDVSGETVAFLQYTSGSTGAPKGVVLRHRQLLAQRWSIRARMGNVGVVVGWLPVFHDMGLIGNVLQVLHEGSSLVLMSPESFLRRPTRWLDAIGHYRARTSGAPNFAYELCARKATEEQRARLDLSSWEVAFCGAEPVREATYRRFSETFEPCGLRSSAFFPCYGLAEASLIVTGNDHGAVPKSCTVRAAALDRGDVVLADMEPGEHAHDRRTLMSCGKPAATEDVRIVEPNGATPARRDRVGEIWVRGPSVASGYWGREAESVAIFEAQLLSEDGPEGPFLRTGDLGFFHEGELYVAGRLKEVIILGGRNLFPQDIESTVVAATPSVRDGGCVAFSIEHEGEERLVIVGEVSASSSPVPTREDIVRDIKRAVVEQHQAAVFDVVLVKKGTVTKTSSGKPERYACRKAYSSGELPPSDLFTIT